MPVSNSADQVDSNINNTIEKEILSEAYLQIIPVTMTNSRRGYRNSYQRGFRYRLRYR